MKISNCNCKLLEQLLQQIQVSDLEDEPILLTTKFNRLLHKFHNTTRPLIECLRELKQIKVYLRYTKKTALTSLLPCYELIDALLDIEIEMCAFYLSSTETDQPKKPPYKKQDNVHWTDQLSDLVEFAYGIVAKRSVNEGRALLKNIIRKLEEAFNVDLSNYPHIFYAIRHRQGDRAVFLKTLHDALNEKMDDMDK